MTRELRSVGGHRQLVEPAADPLAEFGDQPIDALAHQRLAARETDPLHSARDEDVGERDNLLQA